MSLEPGHSTLNAGMGRSTDATQCQNRKRRRFGIALAAADRAPPPVSVLPRAQMVDQRLDHLPVAFRSVHVTPSGNRNFVTVSGPSLLPVNHSS